MYMREAREARMEREEQRKARDEQSQVNRALLAWLNSSGSPRSPAAQGRRRQPRSPADDDDVSEALPLDGSRTKFGCGFRGRVVTKLRPIIFKHMGVGGLVRPYHTVRGKPLSALPLSLSVHPPFCL